MRASELGDVVNKLKLSRDELMDLVPALGLSTAGLGLFVPK